MLDHIGKTAQSKKEFATLKLEKEKPTFFGTSKRSDMVWETTKCEPTEQSLPAAIRAAIGIRNAPSRYGTGLMI